MLTFPNCKINLGLNIVAKRSDGYHDLETIFYPILLKDVLEVVQSPAMNFTASGLEIKGDPSSNLCLKAYTLLQKDFPELPPVNIHLHKVIPMGAGLGGGSSDGAFMLTILNNQFNLQLSEEQLLNYALQLGSDCPFFILNIPVFATGRGEVMEKIELELSPYKFLIVNPGIHISTKEAFETLKPKAPLKSANDIVLQPVETWKNELVNDFESSIFPRYPLLADIKQKIYNAGAVYASMTGTGSTVYGIFEQNQQPDLSTFSNWFHQML